MFLSYLRELCWFNFLHYQTITLPSYSSALLVTYLQQSVEALIYLHDKQVVHRDVAARNISLSPESTVKISDLGMARCLNEDDTYVIQVDGGY